MAEAGSGVLERAPKAERLMKPKVQFPPLEMTPGDVMDFRKSGRVHSKGAFAALEKQWYGKLAESGFKDIEAMPWTMKASSYMQDHHLDVAARARYGATQRTAELMRLAQTASHTFRFPSLTARFLVGLWLRGATGRGAVRQWSARTGRRVRGGDSLVPAITREMVAYAKLAEPEPDPLTDYEEACEQRVAFGHTKRMEGAE